jgi:hypothetical protein
MTLAHSAITPSSFLLVSEIILSWSIANYAIMSDPLQDLKRSSPEEDPISKMWLPVLILRSLALGILILAIAGCGKGSLMLAVLLFVTCVLLPLARKGWVPATYAAELELGTAALVFTLIIICTVHWHLLVRHGLIVLPFSEIRLSAICLVAAIFVFNIRGATYVVRGILNKCGALPKLTMDESNTVAKSANAGTTDTIEFNRGRWIGNLERILLLAIIAAGSYDAMAFLVAAKSLIRSKDLENREWAEYFLLGTLASVTVALGGGLAIRRIIGAFW